jgi:hypothetical protein
MGIVPTVKRNMNHPLVTALKKQESIVVRVEPTAPNKYVGKIYQVDSIGNPTFVLMVGMEWDNPETPYSVMADMLDFAKNLVNALPS